MLKLLTAAAIAALLAGSAFAADLSSKDAPGISPSPTFPNVSSNGFWFQLGNGASFAQAIVKSTDSNVEKVTFSPTGFVTEAAAGYDWRLSRGLFFGPYGSVGYNAATGQGISASAGGELGLEYGNARLKAFAGAAWQHLSINPDGAAGINKTPVGFQFGAEADVFWANNFYTGLRAANTSFDIFEGEGYKVDTSVSTVMVTMGFKTN